MPGTFAVDIPATFSAIVLINATPKPKFGGTPGQQETNAAGIPQWTIEAAVTFSPTIAGMRAVSEMVSVTITDHNHPAQGLNPGTAVLLDGLRVGISPPEQGQNGKIRGGRLWYTATAVRPLAGAATGRRAENAA